MSQENVELVRRGIQSVEAFWALLDEYVVWDLRDRPMLDLDGVYVGRDAVIKASRHYWGTWQDYRLEAEELIDAGSSVVMAVRERGRGKGSGAPFDERYAQVWTFSQCRIIRWEVFQDVARALDAAGLSEYAMSQDNVEVFRRTSEAYNRRDVEGLLEFAHPDVEWHPAAFRALIGAEAAVYRKHDGMRQMFREVDESLARAEAEWFDIRDLGERIVATGRFHIRGRESGAESESPVAIVADFADGKVLRVKTYLDPKEALEAVGLTE
jgi:ketosteroid isomerase-like protein